MDPKEKKVKEEELNVEETLNNAEEQPQDEQAENAAPMTHEEELGRHWKRNWRRLRRPLRSRRINICVSPPSSTITGNAL